MSEWRCELIVRRADAPDVVTELGHTMMRAVVAGIADDHASLELLSALAFHPSAAVRAEVARRDYLNDEAVDHLLADREPSVRQAVFWSAAARRRITLEWARNAVAQDAMSAEDLVRDIDDFPEIDPAACLADLSRHADPAVRAAVAASRAGGRVLLRRLYDDADPDVRQAARDRLEDW